MRLTRDLLIGSARSAADELQLQYEDLICVYLTGSVQEDEPLIGGTTDIDLFCVHSIHAPFAREVLPLGENCHLDIAHYSQSDYGKSKTLRMDPWLGSFLCYKPLVLYDNQHWFEYTQAGVYAHFLQPAVVAERVAPLIKQARQIWLELSQIQPDTTVDNLWKYLKSLELAGNALACLVGVPMTERRFISDLPARCEALERPGLAPGLIDLFYLPEEAEFHWEEWLEQWRKTILTANEKKRIPAKIKTLRIPYYEKAIQASLADSPSQALWILLRIWTLALGQLAKRAPEVAAWRQFVQNIQLGKDKFPARLLALDAYLEAAEETITNWAKQNGAV
jgi:hypothetical protein